jgi:hypothetical protein
VLNVNGTDYTWTTTKTPVTSNYLALMKYYGGAATYCAYGYVKYLQIFNRVLTTTEISNANLGIYPAADTSVVTYNFAEKGGMQHLDTSGNGIILTSTNTSWAVIP